MTKPFHYICVVGLLLLSRMMMVVAEDTAAASNQSNQEINENAPCPLPLLSEQELSDDTSNVTIPLRFYGCTEPSDRHCSDHRLEGEIQLQGTQVVVEGSAFALQLQPQSKKIYVSYRIHDHESSDHYSTNTIYYHESNDLESSSRNTCVILSVSFGSSLIIRREGKWEKLEAGTEDGEFVSDKTSEGTAGGVQQPNSNNRTAPLSSGRDVSVASWLAPILALACIVVLAMIRRRRRVNRIIQQVREMNLEQLEQEQEDQLKSPDDVEEGCRSNDRGADSNNTERKIQQPPSYAVNEYEEREVSGTLVYA